MSSNSPLHHMITDTSKPKKSKHSKQSQNENNMPTVPISVYRELASELETTKRELESLKQKNKQLNQQNQSLRLETRNLVQSLQRLEYTLQYWDQSSQTDSELTHQQALQQAQDHSRFDNWNDDESMDAIPTEMESSDKGKQLSSSQEINGWLLLVIMLLIILSFAGIGFAVARPLLQGEFNQN